MKVYELIQELSKYDAEQEVEINVILDDVLTTVRVREDLEENEDSFRVVLF